MEMTTKEQMIQSEGGDGGAWKESHRHVTGTPRQPTLDAASTVSNSTKAKFLSGTQRTDFFLVTPQLVENMGVRRIAIGHERRMTT